MKSKNQDKCIYFLSRGHLTTNTVQVRNFSVNTIDFKKITRNSETDKDDTKSVNESTWKNVLH